MRDQKLLYRIGQGVLPLLPSPPLECCLPELLDLVATRLSHGMIHTKRVIWIHSITMWVMLVHSRCICHAHVRRWRSLLMLHLRCNAIWRLYGSYITWTCYMIGVRPRVFVSRILLVHPPHPSTSQFGVCVAVPPTINSSLY